jgi:inhibitor of KinA
VTPDNRIVAMGDSAVAVQFEQRIDARLNARAIQVAGLVEAGRFPGVRDVVPTYCSVAVYFDPLRTTVDRLIAWLADIVASVENAPPGDGEVIRVPVCYDGDFGPDLQSVATCAGLSVAEVVETHAAPVYRVFMLGFVPGFAYMGTLDARIAAPRHSTPRLKVQAGSVGIAGLQTGIYPTDTPGGWRLVGRTPLRPFDLSRPAPFLFKAGDRVQFVPIGRDEFHRLSRDS